MTLKLKAKLREKLGKKSAQVRAEGNVPAVLYGHKIDNVNLEINYIDFEKALKEAGESTLIDLSIDGKEPVKTIISEVQVQPGKGRYIHADFHQINMKEKIHATIQLKFIGESRAVKEDGGVVVHNISELEVKCLPSDLVHEIIVDISNLNDFDDTISVQDLPLPKGLEVLHHEPGNIVVTIARPKAEVVEEPIAPVAGEAGAEAVPVEGAETEKKETKA